MKILLVIEFISLTVAALWKHDWFAAAAGVLIPAAALVRVLLVWDKDRRTAVVDVAAVLEGFLLAWQLVTSNWPVLDPVYFPAPDVVLRQFFRELKDMTHGMFSSLFLLGSAYLLSLATAIPGGLVLSGLSLISRMTLQPSTSISLQRPVFFT